MDRRRFLKAAAGLFIPAAPALILPKLVRAQGGMGPGPGTVHSTGGGGNVAFDAFSQGSISSAAGTFNLSWPHTPVGTPTGIIVGLSTFNGLGNAAVTSIVATYGGAAMGSAAVSQVVYAGNGRFVIFGLASPLSGTQTVNLAFTQSGGTSFPIGWAMSVTNSDLATIFRNTNPANGTGTSVSNTVISAAGDLVVDHAGSATGTDTLSSPGAGQTSLTITGRTEQHVSYKAATGASESMTWALSPSNAWYSNAVSVQKA